MDLLMFQELHTRFYMVDTIDFLTKSGIEITGMKNDILRLNRCFNPECHENGIYVSLDRNIFQCKDCNTIGDQFDLLRRYFDLSRKEVWGFLNYLFGFTPPTLTEAETETIMAIMGKLNLQTGAYISANNQANTTESNMTPSVASIAKSEKLERSEDVLNIIIENYAKIEAYSENIPPGSKMDDVLASIITQITNFQLRLNEKPDCLQLARDLVVYNNKVTTFLNAIPS